MYRESCVKYIAWEPPTTFAYMISDGSSQIDADRVLLIRGKRVRNNKNVRVTIYSAGVVGHNACRESPHLILAARQAP